MKSELNHKFLLSIPSKTYKALKVKAAYEDTSVKDIVLFCINKTLGDIKYKKEEQKEIADFTALSNDTFAEEWLSKEDEKAFEHLEKFNKK
jgi:hypothetical protein